ncbi:zinc finger protein 638-like isoform X2 [Ambystoma mexicanum]|uniref:zinc finger protein 638-like isoform X2 n=1 Tax=Ambystoma mexicanum TaxID=8296 RepID=UPI0037E8B228
MAKKKSKGAKSRQQNPGAASQLGMNPLGANFPNINPMDIDPLGLIQLGMFQLGMQQLGMTHGGVNNPYMNPQDMGNSRMGPGDMSQSGLDQRDRQHGMGQRDRIPPLLGKRDMIPPLLGHRERVPPPSQREMGNYAINQRDINNYGPNQRDAMQSGFNHPDRDPGFRFRRESPGAMGHQGPTGSHIQERMGPVQGFQAKYFDSEFNDNFSQNRARDEMNPVQQSQYRVDTRHFPETHQFGNQTKYSSGPWENQASSSVNEFTASTGMGEKSYAKEHSASSDSQFTLESATSILASFGLDSDDLKELSNYPDEELTAENMPLILKNIRLRKTAKAAAAKAQSSGTTQFIDVFKRKWDDYTTQKQYGSNEVTVEGKVYSTPMMSEDNHVMNERKNPSSPVMDYMPNRNMGNSATGNYSEAHTANLPQSLKTVSDIPSKNPVHPKMADTHLSKSVGGPGGKAVGTKVAANPAGKAPSATLVTKQAVSTAGKTAAPAGKTAAPAGKTAAPAGKAAAGVVAPAGKAAAGVVAPAGKAAAGVVAPAGKAAAVVVAPAGKAAAGVVAPAGKAPVVAPAGKAPVVAPAGKAAAVAVVAPAGRIAAPAVVAPAVRAPAPAVVGLADNAQATFPPAGKIAERAALPSKLSAGAVSNKEVVPVGNILAPKAAAPSMHKMVDPYLGLRSELSLLKEQPTVQRFNETKPIAATADTQIKKTPTTSMVYDYNASIPRIFPHICSLCNIATENFKGWVNHQNSNIHIQKCRELRESYPVWFKEVSGMLRKENEGHFSPPERPVAKNTKSRSRSPAFRMEIDDVDPLSLLGLDDYIPRTFVCRSRSRSPSRLQTHYPVRSASNHRAYRSRSPVGLRPESPLPLRDYHQHDYHRQDLSNSGKLCYDPDFKGSLRRQQYPPTRSRSPVHGPELGRKTKRSRSRSRHRDRSPYSSYPPPSGKLPSSSRSSRKIEHDRYSPKKTTPDQGKTSAKTQSVHSRSSSTSRKPKSSTDSLRANAASRQSKSDVIPASSSLKKGGNQSSVTRKTDSLSKEDTRKQSKSKQSSSSRTDRPSSSSRTDRPSSSSRTDRPSSSSRTDRPSSSSRTDRPSSSSRTDRPSSSSRTDRPSSSSRTDRPSSSSRTDRPSSSSRTDRPSSSSRTDRPSSSSRTDRPSSKSGTDSKILVTVNSSKPDAGCASDYDSDCACEAPDTPEKPSISNVKNPEPRSSSSRIHGSGRRSSVKQKHSISTKKNDVCVTLSDDPDTVFVSTEEDDLAPMSSDKAFAESKDTPMIPGIGEGNSAELSDDSEEAAEMEICEGPNPSSNPEATVAKPSEQYALKKLVWIVGNAFIARGSRTTELTQWQKEMRDLNVDVVWLCFDGMLLKDLRQRLCSAPEIRQQQNIPDMIIVHLGADEVTTVEKKIIKESLRNEFLWLTKQYPQANLAFSTMVPIPSWVEKMKQNDFVRRQLNDTVLSFSKLLHIFNIKHTKLRKYSPKKFDADTVQLSEMGMDMFLKDIFSFVKRWRAGGQAP